MDTVVADGSRHGLKHVSYVELWPKHSRNILSFMFTFFNRIHFSVDVVCFSSLKLVTIDLLLLLFPCTFFDFTMLQGQLFSSSNVLYMILQHFQRN